MHAESNRNGHYCTFIHDFSGRERNTAKDRTPQPHSHPQPSAATVHQLATNGETGEPRANHKQAHTDIKPKPETKRTQTTPTPLRA